MIERCVCCNKTLTRKELDIDPDGHYCNKCYSAYREYLRDITDEKNNK